MYLTQLCPLYGITLDWEMIGYNTVINLQMTPKGDLPSCSPGMGGTVLTLSIPGARRDAKRASPKPAAFFSSPLLQRQGFGCIIITPLVPSLPSETNGSSTWFCIFSCSLHVEGKDSF